MTDPRPAPPLPRPAPAAEPGPLDDELYDLVEARFLRLIRDNPVLGTALGLHQDDDLLGDGSREAVLAELAAERDHLARSRGARSRRAVARGRLRARPRAPQRPPRDLRHRRPAHLGTPLVRPRPRSATASSCCSPATMPRFPSGSTHRRPARGDRDLPRGIQDPGDRPAGPALAADRDRDRRRAADLLRRARRRRCRRPGGARAAPPRARERVGQDRHRALRRVARGHARRRHRRVGHRPRAPRRDGRPARVRRPRRRRHPRARLGAARRGARRPRRGRPRDRRRRRRERRHRTREVGPAGLVRGCPRCLSRRDAPGAQPPDRARPDHHPRRRADRHRRDPAVPAQRRPVRGLLRAGRLRSAIRRASTSSPRRSAATRTRCASTTTRRSATPASTRRTRAITSSSTPRVGTAR